MIISGDKRKTNLLLKIPAAVDFVPVASSFGRNAARALGLDDRGAMSLGLALEEIFLYLCGLTMVEPQTEITCDSGFYYVKVDIRFRAEGVNLRPLNLAFKMSAEEIDGEEMSLLVASRLVDRFQFSREDGNLTCLTIYKQKQYEEISADLAESIHSLESFKIRPPKEQEIKLLARRIVTHYPLDSYPRFIRFPGKLVDMTTGGECAQAVAVDPLGRLGGGIIWRLTKGQTVEFFGPYLFNQGQNPEMASALLEACIYSLARSKNLALIGKYASPDMVNKDFQELGSLTTYTQNGPHRAVAWFRLLFEDPGCMSWCHPDLEPYLAGEYQRLVLPREIQTVQDQGEFKPKYSVLSSEFNRRQRSVTIRPVLAGSDVEANLTAHLQLFEKENLPNVFFEIDLDYSWQADFTSALLKLGFKPRMIEPYAGRGDLVIFQLEKEQE